MAAYCDLHTHSTFSDGTNTPTELIRLAEEADLRAVALTDHNTVDGLAEFTAAGATSSVEAIPGIEISVHYGKKELHLVGLFIRPEHYGPIREMLEKGNRLKEESNRLLADTLCRHGYAVDYDAIRRHTSGQVSRAHFAAALTEAGYTASIDEAFETLLHEDSEFYFAPPRPDVLDVIPFLREMGIATVLAHPMLDLTPEALDEFLGKAAACGLNAMETYYPLFSTEETRLARQMAAAHGILEGGGSDYHGTNKHNIRIGVGRGNVHVPMEILENLRKAADG